MVVRRVLDVGCGAGQELTPFTSQGAFGAGIDISPASGPLARGLHARRLPHSRVAFVHGAAERLPFAALSFDVVVCRVALPYMDNNLAIEEMRRVLRPGGILLLKIHHARYYLRQLARALQRGTLRPAIHAARVLAAGTAYHLCGRQVLRRLIGLEVFQTRWSLGRALGGMTVEREMPDSNPHTPSFVIRKGPEAP